VTRGLDLARPAAEIGTSGGQIDGSLVGRYDSIPAAGGIRGVLGDKIVVGGEIRVVLAMALRGA